MMESAVRDLGRLDGPVLCFGGPYSNAQATEALLVEARTRGIPPDRVICTGDVVAYGGDPQACVDLVRNAGIQMVMGNCEESLGFNADDCNCGFEKDSDCAAWSADWFTHAASVLDGDALAWMRCLPRQLRFFLAGRKIAVIHGGDQNISDYVFASTPDVAKAVILDRLNADAGIGGHSGLPFTQVLGPDFGITPALSACPPTTVPRGVGIPSIPAAMTELILRFMVWSTTIMPPPWRSGPSPRACPMPKPWKTDCGRTWRYCPKRNTAFRALPSSPHRCTGQIDLP